LSEYTFRSAKIDVSDLFDERKRAQTLGRMLEAEMVELWGRDRFVVNMRQTHVVKESSSEFVFYFLNGDFLIVESTGRIKFVRH